MAWWWERARAKEQGDKDRAQEAACWGSQAMVFLSLGPCAPAVAACRSSRSLGSPAPQGGLPPPRRHPALAQWDPRSVSEHHSNTNNKKQHTTAQDNSSLGQPHLAVRTCNPTRSRTTHWRVYPSLKLLPSHLASVSSCSPCQEVGGESVDPWPKHHTFNKHISRHLKQQLCHLHTL